MADQAVTLSLVVPAFNEADNLPRLLDRLASTLAELGESYEILIVDDGSSDETPALMRRRVAADGRLRYLRLSRNFGHQVALSAGLDHARGEAVITLDADLQHPPEQIGELVARWRAGAAIVYTKRTDAPRLGLLKRLTSALFYRLMNRLSQTPVPPGAADFRLLDRQVVDCLRQMPERARFLRGLISWVGFDQAVVEYQAGERAAGESKYSLGRMIRFAVDGITGFSSVPLQMASVTGVLVALSGFLYALLIVYHKLFTNRNVPGWTTLVVLILFLGGLQLVFLGILGEYVARIYEEVKARPRYLVREALGFEEPA